MSSVDINIPQHPGHVKPPTLRLDTARGTWAMAWFVATEATLFICLFGAYYYIEKGNERWLVETPPRLNYSVPIFGVLLASSILLFWGQKKIKQRNYTRARIALIGTIILGLGALALSWFEFTQGELHLTPTTDAYGSIFYTINGLHEAHLVLGILMLFWLLFIAKRWEPTQHVPHKPYLNVAIYWHFVVALYVAVLCVTYIAPYLYNAV